MIDNQLLSQAQNGDAEAQHQLAEIYYDQEDYGNAVQWYIKAAEQGHAVAQKDLGFMYDTSKGVEYSVEKAMFWYEKAARQGNAKAQRNLAMKYYNGNNVPQDYEKAVYWFEKATEYKEKQKDSDTYFYLGVCYKDGSGCTANVLKAIEMWQIASDMDDDAAMYQLGSLYCYGNDEAGVEQDQTKAFLYFEKSAMLGRGGSMEMLGECYKNGWGVPASIENAIYWYEKSAETGNSYGQFELGSCYFFGEGVEQDFTKARELFEKSAQEGHELALELLGVIYEDGLAVQRDIPKAIEYYEAYSREASSNIGWSRGQYKIALFYHDGNGVIQDKEKAFELFTLAADAGDSDAQSKLGVLYMTERNDPPSIENIKKSIHYFFMASEQGNVGAAYMAYQLSIMDGDGDPIANSEEELQQLRVRGIRSLIFAAENGHQTAQLELGKRYINGMGVPYNAQEGFRIITHSAENGNTDAMIYLAVHYREGDKIEKNVELAIHWFKAVLEANPNEDKAMVELGRLYQDENKPIDAAEYFAKAGGLGNKYASVMAVFNYTIIGSIFLYEDPGFSFENYQNALRWNYEILNDDTDDTFKNECIENLSEIQLGLGTILYFEEDKGDARPYLSRASQAGLKFADVLLGELEARELTAQRRPKHDFVNAFNTIYNAIRSSAGTFSSDQTALAYSFLGDKLIWGLGTEKNDTFAYENYSIAAQQNSRFANFANKRLTNFRRNSFGGYEYIHN